MNKSTVVSAILDALASELGVLTRGARASFAAATDPDSRAENKYDTRTLEASYVARGQAKRVTELQEAHHQYQVIAQDLAANESVVLGALVELNEEFWYFMGPASGGTEVQVGGDEILVVTPAAPLGQKLMGQKMGDVVDAGNGRLWTITKVL